MRKETLCFRGPLKWKLRLEELSEERGETVSVLLAREVEKLLEDIPEPSIQLMEPRQRMDPLEIEATTICARIDCEIIKEIDTRVGTDAALTIAEWGPPIRSTFLRASAANLLEREGVAPQWASEPVERDVVEEEIMEELERRGF